MNYKKVKYIALFFVLFFLVLDSQVDAQSFYSRRRDKYWLLTGGLGVSSYFGDLNAPGDIIDTRISLNGGLQYNFHSRFAARAELGYFNLKGDDRDSGYEGRAGINLRFSSHNIDLSATGIVYLFPEIGRFYQRPSWNAYFFLGVGLLYFNPTADLPDVDWNGDPIPDAGKKTSLRQYKTEENKYGPITLVFPIGIGVKYKLDPYWNIKLEFAHRYTLTDYLDDVSTVFPGVDSFEDPVAAALSDRTKETGEIGQRERGDIRGNPDARDSYYTLMLGVEFYAFNRIGSKKYKPRRGKGKFR